MNKTKIEECIPCKCGKMMHLKIYLEARPSEYVCECGQIAVILSEDPLRVYQVNLKEEPNEPDSPKFDDDEHTYGWFSRN